MPDPLRAYRAKRRFDRTPEPAAPDERPKPKFPIFVVQKHDARRLHYDLRLESSGVLKSWAVTKIPSLDPAVRRLAVRTEDHPRGYAEFEGVIPEGEYGAGPVVVWDYGVYLNRTQEAERVAPVELGLERGHVVVWLQGLKLRGTFGLSRFKEENGKEYWLLVKATDKYAKGGEVRWNSASVLTGRTIEDVAAGRRKRRRRSSGASKSVRKLAR